MAHALNELGNALMAQLYSIVSGGDEAAPPPKNTFVSWVQPGLAFQPEDFAFSEAGLGGGATAEATRMINAQALSFANLVDFIPNAEGVYGSEKQQTVFRTSQARLSQLYGEILRASKVVHEDLSPEEEQNLERLRGRLYQKKKIRDLITDEETEVTDDSPLLLAYKSKQSSYIREATAYNTRRTMAQVATGADGRMAVLDFQNNGHLYRMQVKNAENDWIGAGRRNEVNDMFAHINQVTQRSMLLWKESLLDRYNDGVVNGMNPGENFFYTTVIPAGFARSQGWTGYELYESSVAQTSNSRSRTWGGGAGLNFGLFSFGGGASGSSSKTTGSTQISKFKLTMELTQVVISRAWFYPEFFMNRGWTLRPGEGWNFDGMPSNGATPPAGLFVGYPTTALFARNIRIESDEFASQYSEYARSLSANANAGWGPFRINGSYGSQDSGRSFSSKVEGCAITVPGMQIIGFVNHLFGKAPDPLPELNDAQFV